MSKIYEAAAREAAAAIIPVIRECRRARISEAVIAAKLSEALKPFRDILPRDKASIIIDEALAIAVKATS